jgi:hypothetical protein
MAKTNKRGSRNKENIPTSEGRAANKATSHRKDKEVASSPKAQEGAEQTTREINVDLQNTRTIDQALLKLMGTSSPIFAHGIVSQLNALSYVGDKPSQGNLNFLVSVVESVKPQDGLEAMLAAQMAAIHKLMFDLNVSFPRVKMHDQQSDLLSAINKLARTFAMQLEALKRYRSKGEQKVTVQHVTVSEGGQAIVGDVHQQQRETGAIAAPQPALTHSKERRMEPISELAKQAVAAERKLAK